MYIYTVCRFNGESWLKRGMLFFRGRGLYPNVHYDLHKPVSTDLTIKLDSVLTKPLGRNDAWGWSV